MVNLVTAFMAAAAAFWRVRGCASPRSRLAGCKLLPCRGQGGQYPVPVVGGGDCQVCAYKSFPGMKTTFDRQRNRRVRHQRRRSSAIATAVAVFAWRGHCRRLGAYFGLALVIVWMVVNMAAAAISAV